MNLEKAGQIAVLGPAAHLLVSFCYLFGYSSGFGGGIGSLFSISDIFGISLTDLMIVYSGGLLLPLVVSANYLRPGYKTPLATAIEKGDIETQKKIERTSALIKKMTIYAIMPYVIFVTFATILSIEYDYRVPYAEMMFIASVTIPIAWYNYAKGLKTSLAFDRLVAIVLTLIAASVIFGLTMGQAERRYDVKQFAETAMSCEAFVVLRSVSDRFLAVGADGRRVVIDDQCEPILKLPVRPPYEQVSYYDLARRFLGFDLSPTRRE